MHVRFGFRCVHCQVKLRCAVTTAGSQRKCPKCSNTFEIPLPSSAALHKFLQEVPVPVPNLSLVEFRKLFNSVVAFGELGVFVRDRSLLPKDQIYRCIDDVVRSLKSIHAFAIHQIEKEDGADQRRGAVPGVRHVAAGSDYAGFGQTKRTQRRYKKWSDSLPPEKFVLPVSSDLSFMQAAIDHFVSAKRAVKN